jgi:uncharacterized protein involved in outer membrane biogenesis
MPAPLPRRTKIALSVAAVLIGVPAVALVVLANLDWNQARPWINEKASAALARPFAIKGALVVKWDKPASGHREGWRTLLPWPHIVANDIHVGSPAGFDGELASVRRLEFALDPFALLHKTLTVPVLRFDSPSIDLQRHADTSNNFTFGTPDQPSAWTLDLERVVFSKGVVRYRDANANADLTADVDPLAADPTYGVQWTLHGSYNGAAASGSGKAGAVLSLKEQTAPYPLLAEVKLGKAVQASVVGTLTKPTALAALDLQLRLSGPSLALLYPATGVVLPDTPPFLTEGRLRGELGLRSSHWTYDSTTGKVGSSDVNGHVEFRSGTPRPMLTGSLVSHQLVFADLGPLIGADSPASKVARGAASAQPSGRVLPVEAFRTERWTSVDADVRFTAERVVRDQELPISKLDTRIVLKDGVLALDPLTFNIAGGDMRASIKLDAAGRDGKGAIRANANVLARHIHLRELFPKVGDLQATVGEINGEAKLSATGNSVATLLAASNGQIKTLIDEGRVSKLLLEKLGLNVGNIVLATLFGDKQVKLNCMAADFAVTNGLMQTRSFIVDTEEAVIKAAGTINLANEQLNLMLKPETKSLRIFSLRSPLYVRGTFSKPEVSVDKGAVAMKAGSAAALAVVALPAALLPLVDTGPAKDSSCARVLADARVKPVAPPPGQRARQ